MLRLTNLADYAVVVMTAAARGDGVLSAGSVATRTGIPAPTVAKVMGLLKRGGLLASSRGVAGGFRLVLAPAAISVADIVEAVDGPIALTNCQHGEVSACALEGSLRGSPALAADQRRGTRCPRRRHARRSGGPRAARPAARHCSRGIRVTDQLDTVFRNDEAHAAVDDLATYKWGFVSDIESELAPKGLTEDTVRYISAKKGEPEWLLDWRLKAFRHWLTMTPPDWAKLNVAPIDYQDAYYYAAPKAKATIGSLDELDPEIRRTYEKLGIPIAEQEMLAGSRGRAASPSTRYSTASASPPPSAPN